MKIIIAATGGTIAQRAVGGRMEVALSAAEIVSGLRTDAEVEAVEISRLHGANLTFDTALDIRDLVLSRADADGFVVTTGTDSMEEIAFALDLLLPPGRPLALTGAMRPPEMVGSDGLSNLIDAVEVVAAPEARDLGALVVMNESIHPARYVRKEDSASLGAFRSHPGPVGQMRRGRPTFHYLGLPPVDRFPDVDRDLLRATQVPIWTMTVSPTLPEAMLAGLHGLIIAGMGTGSIARHTIEQLSPRWTSRLPIVLSSRCPVGLSFDDFIYKGSLDKYESAGFRVLGYEELNPLQARIKLCLELARARPASASR